jgi:hypothetical protein
MGAQLGFSPAFLQGFKKIGLHLSSDLLQRVHRRVKKALFFPLCAFFRSNSQAMFPKMPSSGKKIALFSHSADPSQQVYLMAASVALGGFNKRNY